MLHSLTLAGWARAGFNLARPLELVPLVVSYWLGDAVGLALAYFA